MTDQNSADNVSRRNFLKTSAAASAAVFAPTILPRHVIAQSGTTSPNERLTLGVVGIGPRCTYDMTSILKFDDVRCVAIAEVQDYRRDKGKKLVDDAYGNSDCKLYSDFREMLERPDIDTVLVATGDRWHADASMIAAKAGKDVYSEKPCGITIELCQKLADTMHQEKRVFQAGTQRRSVANFQKAVELAQSGKLGKLKELHASVYIPSLDNSWLPSEPIPDKKVCDWNMWLGPAPWRPFNQRYVDGRWRGQWDFDSGARLLDWGAHTVDLCQWANDADDTMPIEYVPQEDKIVATYENGVKLIMDFLPKPFEDRAPQFITRLGTCPVKFVGEEGTVETGDEGEIVVTPSTLQSEIESTKRVRGLDVSTHARDFFDCVRSRGTTAANPDVMRRSHIACHAAAIAWILQRPVKINPQTEEFIDDPQATLLRSRPARDWTIG